VLGRVLINTSGPDVRFRRIAGHRKTTLNRSKKTQAVRKPSASVRTTVAEAEFWRFIPFCAAMASKSERLQMCPGVFTRPRPLAVIGHRKRFGWIVRYVFPVWSLDS